LDLFLEVLYRIDHLVLLLINFIQELLGLTQSLIALCYEGSKHLPLPRSLAIT
jgi:hypothetical protein